MAEIQASLLAGRSAAGSGSIFAAGSGSTFAASSGSTFAAGSGSGSTFAVSSGSTFAASAPLVVSSARAVRLVVHSGRTARGEQAHRTDKQCLAKHVQGSLHRAMLARSALAEDG
ncbi:hypothetical protein WMF18_41560 [Sorangium sp. So ce315]|uniref:hypothetical protein n=1 Tax=Sorangium sp. So ce315 TaxID=3133299 RepID=UPI003F62D5C2